jgi:hypothetical protein
MDRDSIAYVEHHLATIEQRLKDLRWEMNHRVEKLDSRFEKLEGTVRWAVDMIKGLRGDVRFLAKAVVDLVDDCPSEVPSCGIDVLEENAVREPPDILDVIRLRVDRQ